MTFHQSSYCSSENYSWEKNENSENKNGRKKLDERNRLELLLARLYWRFWALFDRLDPPPKHLPVNYKKWADIRLTLKTLTSSIMINELFIKISSTIKLYNISHFPPPAQPPTRQKPLLAIDKTFLCVKKYGNGWKTAEILQLNFYFMPCCSSGMKIFVSGICKPSPHVCSSGRVPCEKACCRKEKKSIFSVSYWFSFGPDFFHGKNELFSLHWI